MTAQMSRLGALYNYRNIVMLNMRNMCGLDMVQELQVLQLPNLQLLNLNMSLKTSH